MIIDFIKSFIYYPKMPSIYRRAYEENYKFPRIHYARWHCCVGELKLSDECNETWERSTEWKPMYREKPIEKHF